MAPTIKDRNTKNPRPDHGHRIQRSKMYCCVDPNWIHVLAVRFRDSAGRPNKPTPVATLHGILDPPRGVNAIAAFKSRSEVVASRHHF